MIGRGLGTGLNTAGRMLGDNNGVTGSGVSNIEVLIGSRVMGSGTTGSGATGRGALIGSWILGVIRAGIRFWMTSGPPADMVFIGIQV